MVETQLIVLAPEKPEDLPTRLGKLQISFHQGSPFASAPLAEAVGRYGVQSVLVAPGSKMAGSEVDAQVLASLLQIQEVSQQRRELATKIPHSSRPLHVVAPVFSDSTQDVAASILKHLDPEDRITADLLVPDSIEAGTVTQCAAQPGMQDVLAELTTAKDMEIYLRNPKLFGVGQPSGASGQGQSEAVSWNEIVETARALDETALGYVDADGSIVLSPPVDMVRPYGARDQLVVLAVK